MADPEFLAPLLAALRDLASWLDAERVRHAIIGGVAASILGRPRMTRDIDAVVLLDESRWPEFLRAGAAFGFFPRLPDALAFAREARMLLLNHRPSGIDVDIAFGLLPFEEQSVANAVETHIQGVPIMLPRPEDLIVMKAIAHRPRDRADIEAIVDAHPALDIAWIIDLLPLRPDYSNPGVFLRRKSTYPRPHVLHNSSPQLAIGPAGLTPSGAILC